MKKHSSFYVGLLAVLLAVAMIATTLISAGAASNTIPADEIDAIVNTKTDASQITSPFIEVASKVRSSVVGVNSYATRSSYYYGYGFGWDVLDDPDFGLIVCHSGGWPGYSNWYERFVDADRVLIRLRCRDVQDERAWQSFSKGLTAIARDREPDPVRSIEELSVQNPDQSGWNALVGKYDYKIGDFRIEEVFRKDGALYARSSDDGRAIALRLWPLGENRFGIKDLDADLNFSEDGLTLYGVTGMKTK